MAEERSTRRSGRGNVAPEADAHDGVIGQQRQSLSAAVNAAATMVDETAETIKRLRQTKGQVSGVWDKVMTGASELDSVRGEESRIRVEILETDIDSFLQSGKNRTRDLGTVMAAMAQQVKDLGLKIDQTKLLRVSDEDQRNITKLENALEEAQAKLANAGNLWFRSRRESAKEEALFEIETTEAALKEARSRAEINAREKLKELDIERNLQNLLLISSQCVRLMQDDVVGANAQIEAAEAKLEHSFRMKQEASRQKQEASDNLKRTEAELGEEERILAGMSSGTEEHTVQEIKVSDLRTLAKELNGLQLLAVTEYEAREKFTAILQAGVIALISQRDDLEMYIKSIQAETQDRQVSFQTYLQIAKNMADLKMANTVDMIGAETDQSLLEGCAGAMVASGDLRIKKLQVHPQRMKDIHEVTAAMAEHIEKSGQAFTAILADIDRKYGMNELDNSYLQDQYERGKSV